MLESPCRQPSNRVCSFVDLIVQNSKHLKCWLTFQRHLFLKALEMHSQVTSQRFPLIPTFKKKKNPNSVSSLSSHCDMHMSSLWVLEYNLLFWKTPATEVEITELYLGNHSGLPADFLLSYPVFSIPGRRGAYQYKTDHFTSYLNTFHC